MNHRFLPILLAAVLGNGAVAHAAGDATAISDTTAAAPSAASGASTQTTLAVQAKTMDGLAASKGQTVVTNKIASDFSSFAGSTEDAQALVAGLRSGSSITLAGGGTATPTGTTATAGSVTFTPPTGSMGNGNVYISLALAKQQLAAAGIVEPTPEQIQIALMGGTLTAANGTTYQFPGILQMRADGMGWGRIAHTLGTKLGPVVASMKSGNAYLATKVPNQAGTRTASASGIATNISGGSKAGSGVTTMGGTFHGVSSHVGGKGGDVSAARFSNQYYLAHRSSIVTAAGGPAGGVYSSYSSSGNGQGHAYGLSVPKPAGPEVAMGGAVSNGGGNAGGNGKGLGHYK